MHINFHFDHIFFGLLNAHLSFKKDHGNPVCVKSFVIYRNALFFYKIYLISYLNRSIMLFLLSCCIHWDKWFNYRSLKSWSLKINSCSFDCMEDLPVYKGLTSHGNVIITYLWIYYCIVLYKCFYLYLHIFSKYKNFVIKSQSILYSDQNLNYTKSFIYLFL